MILSHRTFLSVDGTCWLIRVVFPSAAQTNLAGLPRPPGTTENITRELQTWSMASTNWLIDPSVCILQSVNVWHHENAPILLSQHEVAEECTPHPPQSTCGIVRMHPPSSVNVWQQENAPPTSSVNVWHRENAPTLHSQRVAAWECTSNLLSQRVASWECTHPPHPPSSVNLWQQENAPILLDQHEAAEEWTSPYIWQLLPNSIRKTTSLYSSATRQLSIPGNIETSFGVRMFFLAVNQ